VQNVGHDEFVQSIMESEDKYLVLFYADWCPFCKSFKPIFEAYDGKLQYKLVGAKVNEDENPLWDMFKLDSIPTMVAFSNGEVVTRRDGKQGVGLSKDDMQSIVKELV